MSTRPKNGLDRVPLSIGEILAAYDPRNEMREGSKARIDEDLLTIEIDTGHYGHTYQIDLTRCSTAGEVLDWIFQIKSKTWATSEIMFDLLTALNVACEIFHGQTVQGCLCPCGVPEEVRWSKKTDF